MDDQKRLKILISAYACEPDKGSEPGAGWNYVTQIARFHDVWVITRANNSECILKASGSAATENIRWVFFDLPAWLRFWKKGHRGIGLYYYLWQVWVYFVAKGLLKNIKFDLVHHITFAKYWAPSFLSMLPIPFVWGPVGGGDSTPKALFGGLSLKGKIFEILRESARRMGELDPFVRIAASRAKLAIATTEATRKRLKVLGCKQVELFSHLALSEEEIAGLSALPIRSEKPFRFVTMGNIIPLKGISLGIEAFAIAQKSLPECEYWLIGDGYEKPSLEKLAARLGISEKIKFFGRLTRKETLEKLAQCDVLVYTCLHDAGVWVTLEAMAAGRPVICLDLSAASAQVTPDTGFRVPVNSHEQVIGDVAKHMQSLALDPALKNNMAAAGRDRVSKIFNWDIKGQYINDIYLKVLR